MSSSRAASRSGLGPLLPGLDLAAESLVLAFEQLVAAQVVDGAMLRGGHEPGARVVRDADCRPLLERGDEGILREFLGKTDVAHDPRETGDDPSRLDPPDRVDRAMCIGSRHGYRSHHVRSFSASRDAPGLSSRLCDRRALLCFGTEIFRTEDLANFGLAFPSGPVPPVHFHETRGAFDGLLSRIQLKDRKAADDFFGFAERAVDRVTCPLETRTRVLFASGERPPLSRIAPVLTASSWSLAISSMILWAERPCSFSECFTSIMNRIVISPFLIRIWELGSWPASTG